MNLRYNAAFKPLFNGFLFANPLFLSIALILVILACALILLFILKQRRRLDLSSPAGRKRFLSLPFRDLSLIRIRSSQFYKSQYYSVSEYEVDLNEVKRAPNSNIETRDYLKLRATDAKGRVRIIHSEEYSVEAKKNLEDLLRGWKKAQVGNS